MELVAHSFAVGVVEPIEGLAGSAGGGLVETEAFTVGAGAGTVGFVPAVAAAAPEAVPVELTEGVADGTGVGEEVQKAKGHEESPEAGAIEERGDANFEESGLVGEKLIADDEHGEGEHGDGVGFGDEEEDERSQPA